MIDIETLEIGDVVRLVSGSPCMTVRGFRETAIAGRGKPLSAARSHVQVVVWSNRHGFLKEEFRPEELCWPRERFEPAPVEVGDDTEGAA